MSREVSNWFKSLFKKADLNEINKGQISNLESRGYPTKVAKIRVEYFNWHPLHLGIETIFDDDIYYSWWFRYVLQPIHILVFIGVIVAASFLLWAFQFLGRSMI
ncbi:hypothetical protein [Lactiplantibacillus carotarum]|uniref:hypothetical protein n=1 Tax=Lactiplantibacillus carotarum TaxID=2993456 RepID=UPI00298EFA93|nr:hypothetical protein [Lactiplantibacillus carotarum]